MNKEYIEKLEEQLVEIGKVLADFHNRIKALEQPEPKCERKIVFDWYINRKLGICKANCYSSDYEIVKELCQMGEFQYVFSAADKGQNIPYIYIGHYE
jgi:hypothetical protein